MADVIEASEIRLIGPDGSCGAILKVVESGAAILSMGPRDQPGGIVMSVDPDGECHFSLNTNDQLSMIQMSTKTDEDGSRASIHLGNGENEPLVSIAAEQNFCTVTLRNWKGRDRARISVVEDRPIVEFLYPDGSRRRVE